MATDISAQQLQQAVPHPKIQYAIAPAEQTAIDDNSINLITVAQAYHWFNFDAFAQEVKRVAAPGAVLAVCCYSLVNTADEKLDALIQHFYTKIAGPYWDAERKWVDENYQNIPFPYDELPTKEFAITVQWTKEDFTGYLHTWSAVQHYRKAHQTDPVELIEKELNSLWPDDKAESFQFPLYLRLGQINS